ncbi:MULTISPECIES: hypothetical protein [unclassified Streptomyces]|uniref:hypothetical protein n=1 Tax=unclassified Streptomyces TaxID=2593676 RepID=UPI003D71E824
MTAPSAVSMSDLLASCAAAEAVSRPPAAPAAPAGAASEGAAESPCGSAAWARPATTLRHPKGDATRHLPRSA